jgi:hypothetical protein
MLGTFIQPGNQPATSGSVDASARPGSGLEINKHPRFEASWRTIQTIIFIDSPRFGHAQSPERIVLRPGRAPGGRVATYIDRQLGRALRIEQIAPDAARQRIGPRRHTLSRHPGPAANGAIELKGQPQYPGITRGSIRIDGSPLQQAKLVPDAVSRGSEAWTKSSWSCGT